MADLGLVVEFMSLTGRVRVSEFWTNFLNWDKVPELGHGSWIGTRFLNWDKVPELRQALRTYLKTNKEENNNAYFMQIFKLAALCAYWKTESANVQVLRLDKYKICNSAKRIISEAESSEARFWLVLNIRLIMNFYQLFL